MKKFILIGLLVTTSSCSVANIPLENKIEKSDTTIVKVSDKGATFSLGISFKNGKGFGVKDNKSGSSAKTSSDIYSYIVYLVKNSNTTEYPAAGDPIGQKVAGPITVSSNGSESQTVTFSNVPSSNGHAYYAAVRAMNASNIDLIKDNNGSVSPWTGITASTPKVAVSIGSGIIVSDSLQVNTNSAMTVKPFLEDAVGAVLEAKVDPQNGNNTLSPITVN